MDGASGAQYLSARLGESGDGVSGGQTGAAGGGGLGKMLGGVAPDKGEGGWSCPGAQWTGSFPSAESPLSLSIVGSRSIHVVAWVRASLLFVPESQPTVCTDPRLFLHPSVHGHLGGFCLLAMMNYAAVNTYVSESLLSILPFLPRRGTASSQVDDIF